MTLRRSLLLAVPLALAAALLWLLLLRGGGEGPSTAQLVAKRQAAVGECLRERAEQMKEERERGEREGEKGEEGERECPGAPESTEDLDKIGEGIVSRLGSSDARGSLGRAVQQRNRLRAKARAELIPGTGGLWKPYGKGALRFDDPDYPASYGDGFGRVNGRVNDLTYVPQTRSLYAAVAQGGVWRSTDLAKTWKPVGETLPIGSTGAVGWTPADGGTLIVATGDHAFSNDYAGVGVYWSTDEGITWVKSRGAPDGALAYRVAVDPTDPQVVYVATGLGLYRSTDGGKSFTNVRLPTGECTGDSLKPNCFFANIVTDVAVQPKDKFGHNGGAVLATVGWRAGNRPNFAGKPESPDNGVFRSDSGAPGSFTKVNGTGYPDSTIAGRAELGVANGADQNADYVYAMVQDADAFNKSTTGGENDIPLVGTPSVLAGIFVSKDFGKTWTRMASREDFYNPANGSALSPLVPLGIGPGYQVTYNQWIKPDPSRADGSGVPTRLLFGMEEVWTSAVPGQPQDGQGNFRAFGQYTANGGACLVIPDQCGAKQNATPTNTTTHPDQHGSTVVPDGKGGITLVVSNDGGVYSQHADSGQEFDNTRWGSGNNDTFYTLLPYGVAVAKDGTAYAGLQDNGQLKISPDGTQRSVYVGDGTFAMVDPDNANINYDELPNAGINVSTDGGKTYSDISPTLSQPDFVAPMVMDPGDAKHIMTAGREIVESTAGENTTSDSWTKVFDLGTQQHPGDANANRPEGDPINGPPPPDPADPYNHAISLQVIGDDAYAGFCGSCDPVKLKQKFHNGIATNVGGPKPGKRLTADGWHIAAARGLPNRFPTSVTMDPRDHRTVYVTLGQSAARYFAPLGSQGDDVVGGSPAGGYVYKSTDAGESFKDITGDLPKVQATWTIVRNGQLLVANAVGVFASKGTDGGAYVPLGSGLPPTATYSMTLKPGDPNTLVAATFGRGVYRYSFADPKPGQLTEPGPGCQDKQAPTSKFKRTARAASARRKLRLSGASSDRGCGPKRRGTVKRIRISIARRTGTRCRSMTTSGKLSRKRTSCRKTRYVSAKGTTKWKLNVKRRLPKGQYQIWVRGIDAAGNVERKSRKRNFKRLRLR